jgi:hypothetical protein
MAGNFRVDSGCSLGKPAIPRMESLLRINSSGPACRHREDAIGMFPIALPIKRLNEASELKYNEN